MLFLLAEYLFFGILLTYLWIHKEDGIFDVYFKLDHERLSKYVNPIVIYAIIVIESIIFWPIHMLYSIGRGDIINNSNYLGLKALSTLNKALHGYIVVIFLPVNLVFYHGPIGSKSIIDWVVLFLLWAVLIKIINVCIHNFMVKGIDKTIEKRIRKITEETDNMEYVSRDQD